MPCTAPWIAIVTINLCIFLQSSSPSFATGLIDTSPTPSPSSSPSQGKITTPHALTHPLSHKREEIQIIHEVCRKTVNPALCSMYAKYDQKVLIMDLKLRVESLHIATEITNFVKETTFNALQNKKIQPLNLALTNVCLASYNQMFASFKSAWSASSDLKKVINHLQDASRSLGHCSDALAHSGNDHSVFSFKVINKFLLKFVSLSDVYSPVDSSNATPAKLVVN